MNAVRKFFIPLTGFFEREMFLFFRKISGDKIFGQYHEYTLMVLRMKCFHQQIIDIFSNGERSIGRQCPRRGGPCEYVYRQLYSGLRLHLEHGYSAGIFHIAIAAGLIEFV